MPGDWDNRSMSNNSTSSYRERLWPSPGLLIALLLLLPAVAMVMTPINAAFAIPTAVAAYALIAGSLVVMSPTVQVAEGFLSAGSARVPVSALGEVQVLDDEALRKTIGPGADARAFLLVRGFIHRGLRIEIVDANDPTPYWVLTSRKPQRFADAIATAKAGVKV
jgi:hypothetical protein